MWLLVCYSMVNVTLLTGGNYCMKDATVLPIAGPYFLMAVRQKMLTMMTTTT